MFLLPDIEINENILSIQSPYTLNGFLIKKVTYNFDYNGRSYYKIKNDNEYTWAVNSFDLKTIYDTIRERNRNRMFEDENRNIKYFFPFDHYINAIEDQCNSFWTGDARDRFIYRLRRQHRDDRYRAEEISNTDINDYSFSTDRATINPNVFRAFIDHRPQNNAMWSISFVDEPAKAKKYIHSYNYKPEYIKHYIPGENQNGLLLGAEIEVAGNTNEPDRESTVKKCIQIINGSEDDKEDLIYSTSDSTVQIELDTMPCTLEFHKNKMNYKELFKYLDEIGYKGHDCENAGLHIHADRSYLGNSELKQQLVITKILYILEKFNNEICVIARRDHEYSKFVGDRNNEKSVVELYNKYKNTGKRVALNLQHENTIEFRCFKSTLKYETFLLTLEFVKDIIDYAKSINIEEIELIQWDDLMNTFSKELKDYYNKRLKKEKDKNLTVDMIKKQIASLNKQINNCVNYLESTRLRKELNNKERKLKELEKKEKKKSINIERSFYTAERLASLDLAVSTHEDVNESLATTCYAVNNGYNTAGTRASAISSARDTVAAMTTDVDYVNPYAVWMGNASTTISNVNASLSNISLGSGTLYANNAVIGTINAETTSI